MQVKKRDERQSRYPLRCLSLVLGKRVIVRLKNGKEYEGELQGCDEHMNLVLEKTEELPKEEMKKLGTIVIRGDTIFYIAI